MIVLISGWKGSGKDTAAAHLVEALGYRQRSFAGVLKDMVASQYRVDRKWFDDRILKETPLLQYPIIAKDGFSEKIHAIMGAEYPVLNGVKYHTPRTLAILEGSIKRSVDANYWVKAALTGIGQQDTVISDWRYRSEHEAVVAMGLAPITIRIDRFATSPSTDPSERDLDNFEFQHRIANSGTIGDLYRNLNDILVSANRKTG